MKGRAVKVLVVAMWVIVLCVLLFDGQVRAMSLAFCLAHRWQAPVLLVLGQTVFASLALPCSPISALAGILWGVRLGFFYSVVATFLASVWTFWLGRYVLRGWVATLELPKPVRSAVGMIERHRWKAVALAFTNPVVPGSSLGYLFGATTISFRIFASGMLVGTLPLQFLLVMFGRGLVKVSLTWVNMVLLAVALFAVLMLIRSGLSRLMKNHFWHAEQE